MGIHDHTCCFSIRHVVFAFSRVKGASAVASTVQTHKFCCQHRSVPEISASRMSTVRQASTVAVRAAVRQPCRGRKCDGPRLREHAQRGASTTCRSSKSQEYTELMKDKMRWNQDAPYDYSFERGLYYHHILENELLCGSQPTCADDIRYLRDMEDVDTIISVCSHRMRLCTQLLCCRSLVVRSRKQLQTCRRLHSRANSLCFQIARCH